MLLPKVPLPAETIVRKGANATFGKLTVILDKFPPYHVIEIGLKNLAELLNRV